MDNFIKELINIRKMPPFKINDTLYEYAFNLLNEFVKDAEGYQNYKIGVEFLEIVPNNYIKENPMFIGDDSAENPYEVLNRFLLNYLEPKAIGRKTLCDNKYTQIVIAHSYKDGNNYFVWIFVYKKVENRNINTALKEITEMKHLQNLDYG